MPSSLTDQLGQLTAKYREDGELITTLSNFPPEHWFKSGRRMGNTTRLADHAINLLFQGKVVLCLDHHEHGSNRFANEELFKVVMRRLNLEHPREVVRSNRSDLVIVLKTPKIY